jgi:hypothetical protein
MTLLKTLAPYDFPSSDAVENYAGRQLLYINWERHRMFSRPFVLALPPETPFGEIIDTHMTDCFSYHPDWARSTGARSSGSSRAAVEAGLRQDASPRTGSSTRT